MIKQQISKFSPYLICSLAAFFYVYDYFIQVSPAVMTHQLMQTFQIGAAGLGLLGSIPLVLQNAELFSSSSSDVILVRGAFCETLGTLTETRNRNISSF